MGFEIRRPGPADAEACARVHVQAWKETYGHLLPSDFFDGDYEERRIAGWRRMVADDREDVRLRVVIADEDADDAAGVVRGDGDAADERFAVEGGRAIGIAMAGAAPSGADVEASPRGRLLWSIYVLASQHGTGVGQALLDAVLGDEPAFLWVEKTNARAQAFYRKNGFALDGVEKVEEDGNWPGITEVRMVR